MIKLAFVLASFIIPKFVINSLEIDTEHTLKKIHKNTAGGQDNLDKIRQILINTGSINEQLTKDDKRTRSVNGNIDLVISDNFLGYLKDKPIEIKKLRVL